ncbi:MAG: ABC transporter permease [Halococcoides sp.]
MPDPLESLADRTREWFAAVGRRPRIRIARREIASLGREKTIVLAILIQLFVAAFSSFLVVGLTSLYDPAATGGEQTIEAAISGDAVEELQRAAAEHDAVSVTPLDSQSAALRALRAGRVDVALHTAVVDRQIAVTAYVPEGSVGPTVYVATVTELLETLERQERIVRADAIERQVLATPRPVESNQYYSFIYTVLVPLLLFLPPYIMGSVVVDTLSEEFERSTIELLEVAPIDRRTILDGKTLGLVALAPIQAAAWLALFAINDIAVARPIALLAFVAGAALALGALGGGLALAFRRRRPAQLLYSILGLTLLAATAAFPEHPVNTVAKLGVGSATPVTWAHLAVIVGGATVAYLVVRWVVGRTADRTGG